MQEQYKFRLGKLRTYLNLIARRVVRETRPVTAIHLIEPAEARFDAPPDDGPWRAFAIGDAWGGRQQWAWFKASAEVPADWSGGPVDLHFMNEVRFLEFPEDDNFAAGPEGQVFIDGRPVGAIDGGHQRIRLNTQSGDKLDIRAVFFAARCACRHTLTALHLARPDLPTEKLHHDLRVTLDVLDQIEESSIAREKLVRAVEAAVDALDTRDLPGSPAVTADVLRDPHGAVFYASVPGAQAAFDHAMAELEPAGDLPTITCVGHAHIDLAWLWPISQTKHKCARTWRTQLRLIEQYPEFVFQQSSPQAYAWMEREVPDLFERIRKRVADGQWEADGAAWVEMDTNLVSGESFVRQLLYGKRYYRDKLGADSRMLWLPDVFGYSAALPQVLKLADVDTFMTQKISWNQYNQFPHHTFRWRGLDGSEIPTHFSLYTYNGLTSGQPVGEVKHHWENYLQKPLQVGPLMPFGHGDGGGGPTEEMLEVAARLSTMPAVPGMPRVKLGKAGDLLRRFAELADELPVWDGELYLEYHRGTYTTQAWLKRANRKNEIRLHNVEWLATLAAGQGFKLDKASLDELWQDLLLMQFHDILPGSSVGEVYDEVRPMQERIAREADAMIDAAADALAQSIDTSGAKRPVVAFNTLSWDRQDPIRLPDGTWRNDVIVPAGGWVVIDADGESAARRAGDVSVSDDGRVIENLHWHLQLNDRGEIATLYDKQRGRSVLPDDARANVWQIFEDRPMKFDAWDIDLYYQDHPLEGPRCTGIKVVERGPVRAAVELTWALPALGDGAQSTITQRIALYANHPRIDFETRIDWHEHHQLLKVAFPVDVRATEATYQIQFGHVRRPTHRNTPWDLARFEACAHQFVDLAEHGYGVSLINDCKYGHDIQDGVIRLTCIKSPQAPHARADQGGHAFTYSLLPHAGTFQEAGMIRAAAELNNPVITRAVQPASGKLPARQGFVTCDAEAIVIDTLKPAEDGKGFILRLYESHGSHARASLQLAETPRSVQVVNLLEEPMDSDVHLAHDGSEIKLSVRPFQIVSLRLSWD